MLNPKLKVLVNKIHDKKLRKKITELLEDPAFETNGSKYSGLPLDTSPAGLSHHHCYVGGYLEHIISTANLAIAMCNSVKNVYRGKVDQDIVIAGVLLHDVFKPVTYVINNNGSYASSQLADYLDHLSLAIAELVRRNFPLELVHVVSAHHGNYSPIRPHTIEALICHLADLMDSRLNGEVLSAAKYLTRKATDTELQRVTSREAFEIVDSKKVEGWEGVRNAVEKIKQKRKMDKA